VEWNCPDCGVWMSSHDPETLEWGIESHVCARPLGDLMLDETRSKLERDVVCLLTGMYGRPFVLFRPGETTIMVS
jgi:hypothetical protein